MERGIEMAGNVWWLLTLPCVLLALLLIGSPEPPVLQRALDIVFARHAERATQGQGPGPRSSQGRFKI